MLSLRTAFKRMTDDGRYEEIAAFHGLPAQCPNADGTMVHTCCLHGMPTFPHWHRLYLALVENELLAKGSALSVPYWDWIEPFDELPGLIADETFEHPESKEIIANPFFKGSISFDNTETTRSPQPDLFGNTQFLESALLAFEQTDFCDFEVQFELLHNYLHAWLGGPDSHSMSSLDYTAYDPVFFIHHSACDRLWAIWQELQRYRKLDYNVANCALHLLSKPMRPFSNSTANQDKLTHSHSKPNDVFDYQNNLEYKYDTLTFSDLNIVQLETLLDSRKSRDRVFAGFMLHGVKISANVYIYICVPIGINLENCHNYVGVFSILGGETEMPWEFDRPFRYEITDVINKHGLMANSEFRISTEVKAVNGSLITQKIFPTPSVIFIPAQGKQLRITILRLLHCKFAYALLSCVAPPKVLQCNLF